eukprot:8174191-Ditylum_brightwellii.AAC.1
MEWILILTMFLTLDAWEEIVSRFGNFGSHKRIPKKEDLDENLAKQHVTHFSQAQDTPFTVEPFSTIFREIPETEFTKEFVLGNINVNQIEGIDSKTKRFLKC